MCHSHFHKIRTLFSLGHRIDLVVVDSHKIFWIPLISPWLSEHEVPCVRIAKNLMCVWTKYELIAKDIRLYREMKQMIGKLVEILK